MDLTFIKSGISEEHDFAWVLAAIRQYDEDGWLVKDELVIAQRAGTKQIKAKHLDKVPSDAWRPVRGKKEEGA